MGYVFFVRDFLTFTILANGIHGGHEGHFDPFWFMFAHFVVFCFCLSAFQAQGFSGMDAFCRYGSLKGYRQGHRPAKELGHRPAGVLIQRAVGYSPVSGGG